MKPNKLIFDETEFKNVVKQSKSISEICRWYKKPKNGYYNNLFDKWIKKFDCNITHFQSEDVAIVCDNCEKTFFVSVGIANKGRRFCSLKCSNTKIRGAVLFNKKPDEELISNRKHIIICFRHHTKRCVICGEENIVTVHHYDENHNNNVPENLIPVCPTHHSYIHSRFKHLIQEKIDDYVENFKVNRAK